MSEYNEPLDTEELPLETISDERDDSKADSVNTLDHINDSESTPVDKNELKEVEDAIVKSLPYSYASDNNVFLRYDEQNNKYCLYYLKGLILEVLTEVRRFIGKPITAEELDEKDFQKGLTLAYQKSSNEAQQAADDIGSDLDLTRLADEIPETSDLMSGEDDAPVIRLINAVLSQAVREHASDIHIETFEENLVIRFRIDGVLSEILKPKRMLAPLLVSRLKVMAKLDIAEKRIPQDGRISIRIAGHAVDIRMSTNPTAHGERLVLRLLDKQAGQLELTQLKMPAITIDGYKRMLGFPHGIVLVTGPTGSGKTTTLYAGLTHINDTSRNILTIEDPVEYLLEGIGQTQVNNKVDMTFAKGLRAILRQDPDVVMIGEIRDIETAQVAVQASLTGHLVLSTLHTNTAVGAITRLNDMGVEPFLLASSLGAIIAQRLVRTLCPHCKKAYEPDAKGKELVEHLHEEHNGDVKFYKSIGCDKCNYQGFKGRSGIYEYIEVDDQIRSFIHEKATEQEIVSYVRITYPSIRDDGFMQALRGETTIEEVLRVTAG